MKRTKIDWCDCTINPVVGCQNGCKYCYGEKINCRFHIVKNWKQPEYFHERLKQFESKTPKSVFIDSMSDIGCWRQDWFDEVMAKLVANPQHRYIALTKRLDGFKEREQVRFRKTANIRPFNLFIGVSVTNNAPPPIKPLNVDFLSVEPLLEAVDIIPYIDGVLKLVIIGAETGNRKGKVIPQKEWVDLIVDAADIYGIKVFMKESLRKIMGDDFRQDMLLWDCWQLKVGDTVYQTDGVRIYSSVITNIIADGEKTIYDTDGVAFDKLAVGERVFLTQEQAQARLKGLRGGF